MDYTKLMYDAAHTAYEQNGEVHAYTGLCHGLSAVARELGLDLPFRHFSNYHHDPLATLSDFFAKENLTFEQFVRMWDLQWFGHGTGHFHGAYDLTYPFSKPDSVAITGGYHTINLTWIKEEVLKTLKQLKMRRGTKKHAAFITENAQKVLEAAAKAAENSAAATARNLEDSNKKISKLYQQALEKMEGLALEAKLRDSLLQAAGLEGSPSVTAEMSLRHSAWANAAEVLGGKLSYIEERLGELADPNKNTIAAVEAMSRDDVLAPFAKASGLVA